MSLYSLVAQGLGSLALGAAVVGVLLLGALALPIRTTLAEWAGGRQRLLVGAAWLTAAVATSGSLWFSEVVGFIPCELCWYQRIAMYPLVVVLGVGLLGDGGGAWRFGLPLALLGLPVSLYHIALQQWPGAVASACQGGVPCSAVYLAVMGFVTIPVMAGGGFLLIAALLTLVALGRRISSRAASDGGRPSSRARRG